MVYGKKQIGLAFLLTALAGCLLHGLYALWPNAFTALASPIWESLWEHLKILAWPYLAAALVLTWNRPTGIRPWLLSLLLMCAGMLGGGVPVPHRSGGRVLLAGPGAVSAPSAVRLLVSTAVLRPLRGGEMEAAPGGGGGPPAADGPVYPVAPGPPAVCGPVRGGHLEPAALLTSFLSPAALVY